MIEAFQTLLTMIDMYLKILNFKENLMWKDNEQLSCYTNATPQKDKFVEVLKKLVFSIVNKSALLPLISLISPSFE